MNKKLLLVWLSSMSAIFVDVHLSDRASKNAHNFVFCSSKDGSQWCTSNRYNAK